MVVIVTENAPQRLRGELTRWMLEAKAGVFIGTMSATVRELLWKKVKESSSTGGALLIYSSDSEQGYRLDMHGAPQRKVVDIEGITLIKTQ